MMTYAETVAVASVAAVRARKSHAPSSEPPADFASDAHREFFFSRAPEAMLSGWMGAGKSRVLCEKAWWIARAYPGVTVGLFRKVAASLPATTERTFLRDVMDPRLIASRNRSENWYELTNGSRIYFLGLDPDPITGIPSKVGSLDLGWAGVDEAVECSEGDWIVLLGRLRDPRMDWHQLAAATNPGPPAHWLRLRMTSGDRTMLQATSNKFLPADFLAMLANLPDTAQGRRLGKGEWVGAEGAIYHLPDSQVCEPEFPVFHSVVAGVDWGFVHAFACEVLGRTGSGRLAFIDEVYERGRTVGALIPSLKDLQVRYGIRTFYADPSEPAYIAECRQAGLPIVAARNDVRPGIDAMTAALADGMTISPRCAGLLGELPSYTWQPQRGGGFREVPVEINDDACDAARYAVISLMPGDNPFAQSFAVAGGVA